MADFKLSVHELIDNLGVSWLREHLGGDWEKDISSGKTVLLPAAEIDDPSIGRALVPWFQIVRHIETLYEFHP